ncbi:MAG: hypothetical protein Q8Q35_00380, partial [Nanoarchaeota archaeon]|nr:hypothetical protein [Nanoarchaeota archaeon]
MVNKKHLFYIILLIIVLGSHIIYYDFNKENLYWDEVVFLQLADNIGEGSYHSELGEHYRPPLFPFILSFFGYKYTHLLMLIFS